MSFALILAIIPALITSLHFDICEKIEIIVDRREEY
jgi:hypothetical protein